MSIPCTGAEGGSLQRLIPSSQTIEASASNIVATCVPAASGTNGVSNMSDSSMEFSVLSDLQHAQLDLAAQEVQLATGTLMELVRSTDTGAIRPPRQANRLGSSSRNPTRHTHGRLEGGAW